MGFRLAVERVGILITLARSEEVSPKPIRHIIKFWYTMTFVASAQMLPAMPCAGPAAPSQRILRVRAPAWGFAPRTGWWTASASLMGSARRQDRRRVLRCRATPSEGSDFDLSDFVEGKVFEGELLVTEVNKLPFWSSGTGLLRNTVGTRKSTLEYGHRVRYCSAAHG